ncbi:Dynein light chain [Rhodotorula kratochvilovae]
MSAQPLTDGTPAPETPKPIIKSADMAEDMQEIAIQVATEAMKVSDAEEKDIAAHIKRDFDKRYGPTWHVVVGKKTGHFLYWYMGNIAILLFKAG